MTIRIFVPRDAGAVAVGADEECSSSYSCSRPLGELEPALAEPSITNPEDFGSGVELRYLLGSPLNFSRHAAQQK